MDTRDWLQEYKKTLKCMDCGESDPICLLFHHVIRDLKIEAIYKMVENNYTIEEIHKEIDKCIVLCWNCHLKLHRDLREQSSYNIELVDFLPE
jgi:hypothetical protein